MSTDIVIVLIFFAGQIRDYSPSAWVSFTRTAAGGIATSIWDYDIFSNWCCGQVKVV